MVKADDQRGGLLSCHKALMVIGLCIAFLGIGQETSSQPMRTGRSTALAGSSTLGMWGAQASSWNPALLGLKANPKFSLLFPSVGLSVGNNAFSPQYIVDHFQEGDTLTEDDKQDILSQMGKDRLSLHFSLGVPVFGFSVGNLALGIEAHSGLRFSLPRDLFELALTGPRRDVVYDFRSLELESASYGALSLSYGQNITSPINMVRELSLGVTARFIQGLAFSTLERKDAFLQITQETIRAQGTTKMVTGTKGGQGYGLDLGVVGTMGEHLIVGLTLGNPIGSIKWRDAEAREAIFSRNSGLHPDSLSNADYYKHFFTQEDTTYTLNSYQTPLSRYLMVSGTLVHKKNKGFLAVSYYQGFNTTPFQNTTPRFSMGGEWRPLVILPLRAGFSLGGIEGLELGGGIGLHLLGYQLNLGASWQGGVMTGAKGFSFALTQTITPLPRFH